jgi:hypothetical protein
VITLNGEKSHFPYIHQQETLLLKVLILKCFLSFMLQFCCPRVAYIQKIKISNSERDKNHQVWKTVSKHILSNNIYLMQSTVCVVMKQQSAYLKIYIPIHHTWWNLGLNGPCKLTNKLLSKYSSQKDTWYYKSILTFLVFSIICLVIGFTSECSLA